MKSFLQKLFERPGTKLFGQTCLLMIAWFAVQEIVAAMYVTLFSATMPCGTGIISSLDRIPPISRFVTSLTSFFQTIPILHHDVFLLAGHLVLQFVVFVTFTSLAVKMIGNHQTIHPKPTGFFGTLKNTVIFTPIILVTASIGLMLDVLLARMKITSFLTNAFFVSARDGFVLSAFFCMMFAYVFASHDGKTGQFFSRYVSVIPKVLLSGLLPAFTVSLATNLLYLAFLDSRFVTTVLFVPAKITLQSFGWSVWAGVWLFTRNVYDNLNIKKDSVNATMPKGAENEQILETSY